jgi:hypothetical protein
MKYTFRSFTSLGLLCCALLIGYRCATTHQTLNSRDSMIADQVIIEKKFSDYMSYRKMINLQSIYSLATPKYKKDVSFEVFKDLPAIALSGLIAFNIQSIEVNGDKATVWYTEYVGLPGIPTRLIRANEFRNWTKVKKEWCIELNRPEDYRTEPKPMICGLDSPPKTILPPQYTPSAENPVCGN